jgi:hypothetical protein
MKFEIRILFLTMLLAGMIQVPAVNAQKENNYSVTSEEAFEHVNAFIISYPSIAYENWNGASVDLEPLELYDINGQKLLYEFSVYENNEVIGKIDVAANKTLGRPIQMIKIDPGPFNSTEAVEKSMEVANNKYPDGEIKSTKMVAYHYDQDRGAMTVIKDSTGNEHRIFVDAYTLDVVEDKPATETEPGVWSGVSSIYEQRLEYGIDENLKEWQKSDEFTRSVEKEAANKGICISVPVTPDDYRNSEINNVDYDYYNYFFGLNSYGNTVIARYGEPPVLKTDDQKESWNSTLEELGNNIKDTFASEYIYPHGEVVTCGANEKGYFIILFKYGNVNKLLMNNIYYRIDNAANIGIRGIPVEFGYGTYREQIELGQEGRYYEFGESTRNLSESDIHAIEKYVKRKPTNIEGNIVVYGKIPLLKDSKEIDSWQDKLLLIKSNSEKEILPYEERGQVITYKVELTRLGVGVNETLPIEEKTTIVKKIYRIIDEEARIQNITGVPVVFYQEEFVNLTTTKDTGTIEDITNLSASEDENTLKSNNSIKSESDNDSSLYGGKLNEISSTPGFGFLGSLTCLYGGWKLRRRI